MMSVERVAGDKANGNMTDDIQFIEKIFGQGWDNCHLNQGVLYREGKICFITV